MRGISGNFAANARVFAHHANVVHLTAAATGLARMNSTNITNAGSGYTNAAGSRNGWYTGVATTHSGTGTGMTVDCMLMNGTITLIYINNPGTGGSYTVGSTITVATGGANATATLSTALAGTSERGAALYVGAAMNNIVITMESGLNRTFTSITANTYMPIAVTEVVSATPAAGNFIPGTILALY